MKLEPIIQSEVSQKEKHQYSILTDWFQIRKGVRQGCILSPCLFNLYAEYINNLRYADDTTLMTESEEELKSS